MPAIVRVLMLVGLAATLQGGVQRPPASYHVAATALPSGDGSSRRPWDLQTALAGAGGRIRAGDTVWVHAGRYPGAFATTLIGDSARPIVFRARPGERATIDGTLKADGAFLTFWGFEIMQSRPATYGLEARTNGGRFVNLVIHDAGTMGVSFWTPGVNAELYGCIIYHNGTHENLDHGVYVHNEQGTKVLADNVVFENLAYGIHVYAKAGNPPQQNVRVEGNIVFDNGTIARRYRAKGNVLVGGDVVMTGMQIVDNALFFARPEGEDLRVGYAPVANGNVVVQRNVIWGGATGIRLENWRTAVVSGNIVGGASELIHGDVAAEGNHLYQPGQTPPAPIVIVRPNRYEPGRAYVAVYAWSDRSNVRIDLSQVLQRGDDYEVRRVQDPFGKALARGRFGGDSVAVPLPGIGARFGAFLVTATGAAGPSGKSR